MKGQAFSTCRAGSNLIRFGIVEHEERDHCKKQRGSPDSAGEQELVAKSPACDSISAEGAPVDDEKKFQGITAVVTDLKRELEHSRKLREALQEEVKDLRTDKEAAETLVAARAREIERVEKKASSFQTEAEQLTADLADSEKERSEAVKEINRLKAELKGKNKDLLGLKEDLSTMESEVAHLTRTRGNLKKIHDSLKSVQQMCSFSESNPDQPEKKSQES